MSDLKNNRIGGGWLYDQYPDIKLYRLSSNGNIAIHLKGDMIEVSTDKEPMAFRIQWQPDDDAHEFPISKSDEVWIRQVIHQTYLRVLDIAGVRI